MYVGCYILVFFYTVIDDYFGLDYDYFTLYPDHFSSSDMDWVSLG